jgi:hypothetical protein
MAPKDLAAKTAATERILPKAQAKEDNQVIVQDQLKVDKAAQHPVRKVRVNVQRTVVAVKQEAQARTAVVTLALAATVLVAKDRAQDKANVEAAKVIQAITTAIAAIVQTAVAVDVVMTTTVAATSAVTVVARTTATEINNSTNNVRKLITHLRKSSYVVT